MRVMGFGHLLTRVRVRVRVLPALRTSRRGLFILVSTGKKSGIARPRGRYTAEPEGESAPLATLFFAVLLHFRRQ